MKRMMAASFCFVVTTFMYYCAAAAVQNVERVA